MAQLLKYSLTDIEQIIFNGFDFNLPDETINIIKELSSQVGSPTYIKTPTFKKKQDTQINQPFSEHIILFPYS